MMHAKVERFRSLNSRKTPASDCTVTFAATIGQIDLVEVYVSRILVFTSAPDILYIRLCKRVVTLLTVYIS